ncbi:MAG: hypothetical protein A2493_00945 [Candidatus Magasanikbacteria bacterium RIFOXYC12_FULL_33_11]|uniref:Bacterial Ig-like domain-containing protein n=1 Tax=Candidatus Magasanikbacteria bacterium RIFOXYC12_FULL_33_11 TaxID=1798701 RepID=A0A1F6NRV1_9BACT|nr:MAG: hypothetical protein A2493_00945 [Candidatus Magasanikbacteria bacterium RIFOXYC12_FULL_33_11]
MKRQLTIFLLFLLVVFFLSTNVFAGTITNPHYYAWSNNVGWISFKDTVVSDSALTGYAWSSTNGWIKMNPSNGGIVNDGQGNLSGYAWGEGLGWINFSGVTISSGIFSGNATGDSIGTLTFDCTNCDVQTDWVPTPISGGGGSTPPPVEDPPPEETTPTTTEENLPTGAVQINNGSQYTNSLIVNLDFVTDYVDSYAISNSNNFSNATFLDIVSSTQFTLSSGDGNKNVYVRFKNQYGTVDASDSIILDTTAPNIPIISQIDNGVENGVVIRPAKVYGTAEANAQIIITKATIGTQAAGVVSLAEVSTYNTNANSQGDWSYTFSSIFSPGSYGLSANAKDAAGNISGVSLTSNLFIPELQVENPPEEIPPEEVPPEENQPPEETENTETTDGSTEDIGDGAGSGGNTTNNTEVDSIPSNVGTNSSSTIEKIFSSSTILNIVESVKNTVENIQEQFNNVTESVRENVQIVTKKVVENVQTITNKVAEVVNNPEVEKVNKIVVTPVVATVAVVNVASSGFGFVNIVNLFRVFFGQFFLVFRRKKQKKWGVLYNAFTKKPIDLASIRLIDVATNKVVRSMVTDTDGRYILSAQPGNYKIQVNKNGYIGFSEHLQNVSEDSAFINLYHGEDIKVNDASEINYNIPLDPIEKDRSYLQIMRDKSHKVVRSVLSTTGLVFSVVSFIITPVWWVGVLVIFQFILYLTIRHFSFVKLPSSFGVITAHGEEKPLSNVAVRVFDAAFNKLIETTVSDRKGRYAVLLGPSKYYVTYEKEKYDKKKSPLLDFSLKNTHGSGGILVRDESLKKLDKN